MFYLFKLFYLVLKDVFWSICLTLILFSAPVLVYYGNNFLSDAAALAFGITAWYYYLLYHQHKKQKTFYIAVSMAVLAGFLKVSALLSLFTFIGIEIIYLLKSNYQLKQPIVWTNYKRIFIPIMGVFCVAAWVFYAAYYNAVNDCTYFSTTTFPIWDLKPELVTFILQNIKTLWLPQYFNTVSYGLLLGFVLMLILNFRKIEHWLLWAIGILFVQAIVFILFQFWTFNDHDYYVINLYIIPIILMIAVANMLQQYYPELIRSVIAKIILLFIVIYGLYDAKTKLHERYNSWMNDYPANKDFYTIRPYLDSIGIKKGDTAIVIPDFSHANLYLSNLRGWTEYADARFNRGEKIYYNNDSLSVAKSIKNGAQYLLVNGVEELLRRNHLHGFTNHLMGRHGNILIFDLHNSIKNFSIGNLQDSTVYFCGAESVSGNNFIDVRGREYEFAQTRSSEKVFSGNYAVKLSKDSPYALTTTFEEVKLGDSFKISGWRKGKIALIFSAEAQELFYDNQYKIVEKRSDGWEKIEKEVFIPEKLNGKTIKIYLVHDDEGISYFDDLRIVHVQRKLGF